jgi:hypothetical protein
MNTQTSVYAKKCTLLDHIPGRAHTYSHIDMHDIDRCMSLKIQTKLHHKLHMCKFHTLNVFTWQVGTFDRSMRLKEHAHIFVNTGGSLGALDFRMGGVGAPFNGLKAFATTEQLGLYDKIMNAIRYFLCGHVGA